MSDKVKCPDPEQIKAMNPEELLEQFDRLKFRVAKRFISTVERYAWIDEEDICQIADIALLKAQKAYKPMDEASFITFAYRIMVYDIMKALKIRCDGNGYTNEPITVSLDEPIDEEGDITRGDIIPSKDIPISEQMEVLDIISKVRNAVSALPEDQEELIRRRYLNDPAETQVQIAEEKGVPVHIITGIRNRAFKKLRRDLRDYQDYIPNHIGSSKFNSTWTSEPEQYVIARESRLKQLERSYKELFQNDKEENHNEKPVEQSIYTAEQDVWNGG